MLLTKTITKTEDIQVEVKTPSFYKTEIPTRYFMVCENGDVVYVGETIIILYQAQGFGGNKKELERALSGVEISEDEFMTAYDATLKAFENPMFPESLKPAI